ncbi:MAG: SDR family oxidoreductase [Chloroflexi bacterium]|nr:SDR family oxidoreductase [Chloroflexota bacterium]
MDGKVCLVTGASNGIGLVTAAELARNGASVLMVARDPTRGETARLEVVRRSGSEKVSLLLADLSSLRDVERLAAEVRSRCDRLDVLVNNAGAFHMRRHTSPDGYELTFALNHLAYFALSNLLLDMLKASAPARIVNVSSAAHKGAHIDFDDLHFERRYSGTRAYGQSKLANVLHAYELARRLAGTGVTANALHPGVVRTGFGKNNPGVVGTLFGVAQVIARPVYISPERGALTSIYLASSPEVEGVSGKYFVKSREVPSTPLSYDEPTAARLWDLSEELVAGAAARARGG